MRTILDEVDPVEIRPVFPRVYRELERSGKLRKFVFLEGGYLASLDGTGYFSSKTIHCACCIQKVNKKTGQVTYYHQMVGGVIVLLQMEMEKSDIRVSIHPEEKQ
ncbi:MAG: hypothetical protein GY847_37820 [Proteobacteria bacterium]|nr:hypothetical protein [Pseudomonadota bacterium]